MSVCRVWETFLSVKTHFLYSKSPSKKRDPILLPKASFTVWPTKKHQQQKRKGENGIVIGKKAQQEMLTI